MEAGGFQAVGEGRTPLVYPEEEGGEEYLLADPWSMIGGRRKFLSWESLDGRSGRGFRWR
jgi:hypothetical protein